MKPLTWLALCVLCIGAPDALAQGRSVSYSTWTVADNMVTLRFVLPVTEAQQLLGVDVPVLTTSKLEDYLLEHLTVDSAGGGCPAIDQGFDLGRVDPLAVGAGYYGFEIFFRCRDPRQLVFHNNALFGRSPGHVNFARVVAQGHSVEQLFTAGQQQLTLPANRPMAPAALTSYMHLGLTHILESLDRLIFVLGALLLVRHWRDARWLAGALLAGYLLSLAPAVREWILPRATLIEAFMGLLVGLTGIVLIQRAAPNPRVPALAWSAVLVLVAIVAFTRSSLAAVAILGGAAFSAGLLELSQQLKGRLIIWPALAVAFTFLDGFSLSALLGPADFSPAGRVRSLLGFDLGAVLTILVLLGLAMGLWRVSRNVRWAAPRAAISDVCAAGITGLGVFWLVSRL